LPEPSRTDAYVMRGSQGGRPHENRATHYGPFSGWIDRGAASCRRRNRAWRGAPRSSGARSPRRAAAVPSYSSTAAASHKWLNRWPNPPIFGRFSPIMIRYRSCASASTNSKILVQDSADYDHSAQSKRGSWDVSVLPARNQGREDDDGSTIATGSGHAVRRAQGKTRWI